MYICLCNCLKDCQVNSAIADGATSVSEVYKSLGCRPQCGKCIPYIRENMVSISADSNAA